MSGLRWSLARSVAAGMVGGAIGFVYLGLLHLLEGFLEPSAHGPLAHLFVMMFVGLSVHVLARWIGSPGDIELVVDNVHVLHGRSNLKSLLSLLPISLLCIASGGGAGPEAPLVQTTGSLSQWGAERLRLSPMERRHLTIAGMASGFTVLFGAPLAAAVFALEILHRRGLQYYESLLPALVSSLVGYIVYVLASGLGLTPVWAIPSAEALRAVDLAWAGGAGVVGAAVAGAFIVVIGVMRRIVSGLPAVAQPVLGGIVLGGLAFLSPFALTYGKAQVGVIVGTTAGAGFFFLAALAKFCGTSVTVASGWRGGFIIPLFFIGVALARAIHGVMPGSNEAVLCAALMAATNAGVTKTPLGSTLVVLKMTGLALIPTTILAAMISFLLTIRIGLFESQRERVDTNEQRPEALSA